MAEYGEWNQKGASLSDKTARKEYKVDQEFIVKGIEDANLNSAIHPYGAIPLSEF
jgi:hypothetical protein